MSFSTVWSTLQTNLKGSTTIANWTADKGAWGESFEAEVLNSNSILVSGAEIAPRPVRRKDFEKVYASWERYSRRELPRSKLPNTVHSKYIISLLRWAQEQSGGKLP